VSDLADVSELIGRLMRGNEAYREKTGEEELARHAAGQSPRVVVLTCADSRVVPEKIFDAGIGELFTIRVAGNLAYEDSVIQSIEYAVAHLHSPLVLVLGHTGCGAVAAAIEAGYGATGILAEIRASICEEDNVVSNLRRQLEMLPERSEVVRKAVEAGELELRGAVYALEDGHVTFL